MARDAFMEGLYRASKICDKRTEALSEEHQKTIIDMEHTAESGYLEAYKIIMDLRNRIEDQDEEINELKEEFGQRLEEGYEEAYQMLKEKKKENNTLKRRVKVLESQISDLEEKQMYDLDGDYIPYPDNEDY